MRRSMSNNTLNPKELCKFPAPPLRIQSPLGLTAASVASAGEMVDTKEVGDSLRSVYTYVGEIIAGVLVTEYSS